MFKSAFFFIMTFMMCFTAGARSYVRSHADFVHLSDYQKNQHIIKVMELVVELESKYEFETKKYGFNQERFERFQKAIEKISSVLFVGNAYADSTYPGSVSRSDWNGIGQSFGQILNAAEGGQNRCIFAGWVSETAVGPDGKTYCNHPVRSPRAAQGYPDPEAGSGCSRGNTNSIQCNPVIFGYKKASSKSLFCVSTDDRAKNSSYHCMEKALGIVTEANSDTHADRLASLRTNLSSNPAIYEQVQEFVYRTCVCDSTHQNFNQAYQNAIRPHRTCYGLMNMIGETVSCENPSLPLGDKSIFESLKQFMQTRSISETTADGHYQQFLNGLGRDSSEYRRLCQIPSEPKNWICESVTCEQGESGLTCDYVVKEEGSTARATFSTEPTQVPAEGDSSLAITFEVGGVPGNATCSTINRPTAAIAYTCTATCRIPAVATPTTPETDNEAPPAPPAEGGGEETPAQPQPGCDLTVLGNGTPVEGFEKVRDPEMPTAAGETSLDFVIRINNEEKTLSCPTTVESLPPVTTPEVPTEDTTDENTDDKTPTLTVVITNEGAEAYDIKATPTDAEGWTFAWSSNPPEGKSVTNTWETASAENSGTEGLATSGLETETTATNGPGDKEITQPRYDFDYEVIGTLTKTGETPITGKVTVKKKAAEAADDNPRSAFPNVNPNLVPGNQMQIRGTSDTSAIGIR